ncbi:MAG: hypothetical protein ABI212_08025 [Burkholderiaceae bacterium]
MTNPSGIGLERDASDEAEGRAAFSAESPLKPEWAFVFQLRQGTSFTADTICGRIEHVVSGQACLFDSLEQARSFMELVMTHGSPQL